MTFFGMMCLNAPDICKRAFNSSVFITMSYTNGRTTTRVEKIINMTTVQ